MKIYYESRLLIIISSEIPRWSSTELTPKSGGEMRNRVPQGGTSSPTSSDVADYVGRRPKVISKDLFFYYFNRFSKIRVINFDDVNAFGHGANIDTGLVPAICQFSEFLAHSAKYLNIIKRIIT
jgi:hypothetical protein